MSVGVNGTHDLRLESSVSNPTTTLDLLLAEDIDEQGKGTGRKMWTEKRLPPYPLRLYHLAPQSVRYADKDPFRDLVFSQNSWADGALQTVFDPTNEPHRYAKSVGADLRWDNVAVLGMKQEARIDFLVQNSQGEVAATTGWTAGTGHTLTNVATSPYSGSRHFSLATTGGTGFTYYALTNPTVYQGRSITVTVMTKKSSGSGTLSLQIDDGVTQTTTAVSTSTSAYFSVTATQTIDGAATYVRLGFKDTAATGTWFFDNVQVSPAGGVVCAGFAEAATKQYIIVGRMVLQWDSANSKWDAVYLHASAVATSIVEFNGNIFVAFGNGNNAYIYGTGTSWTVATGAANDKYAHFFTVSRQTLWRSRATSSTAHNLVASNTNPVNGGAAWSTEYTIGSSDRVITSMNNFNDSVVVGKSDGLYTYRRTYDDGTAADLFLNNTNEWANFVDTDNFVRMKEWHGWMYMTASQQSLFRFNGVQFQDLSALFQAPRITGDFGGRIRAMTSEPAQLWLMMDAAAADNSTNKKTWLLSLREVNGKFRVHTIDQVSVGDINVLEANRSFVWVFGRFFNTDSNAYEAAIYRWDLPVKSVAPAYDSAPLINTTGSFDTAIWDGTLPDEQKAFIALTIFVKNNLDANHTIVVKYGLDGASSTTTTLGTFNSSGNILTKFFDAVSTPETNAIGRSIQLNFQLNTNDTVSPELYAIAVHTTLRPVLVKTYEVTVQIGEGTIQYNGATDPESKLTKVNKLLTLEGQVYPVRLTASRVGDGSNDLSQQAVQIIPGTIERVKTEERVNGVELWKFIMQEVTVA